MEPDDYRPDPPTGLGYADFRAARARFQARLARQSDIARLERALTLPPPDRTAAGGRLAARWAADPRADGRRPAAGTPG
jgi:hypothetical protein